LKSPAFVRGFFVFGGRIDVPDARFLATPPSLFAEDQTRHGVAPAHFIGGVVSE